MDNMADDEEDVVTLAAHAINMMNSGHDHNHCLVCYSELTVRGKTPCDHNDICGVCHLRLRHLHDDKHCPICKTTNETIIVDYESDQKLFEQYPLWGSELGAGYYFEESVGMFFPIIYHEQEILPLFRYACTKCDYDPIYNVNGTAATEVTTGDVAKPDSIASKNNKKVQTSPLRLLQDHLRTQHRLAMCQLCVDNQRDFVARLPRMTAKQLQTHLRNGDGADSGFTGHPVCEFCHPKRFYDLTALHMHLQKDHYNCHVCTSMGLPNQFFKNYSSLERHFDTQHFLCHDVQCLAARFVVFENELDLRGHELRVHGGTSSGSTKVNLEFRTRRQGFDGSGYEAQQQRAPSSDDFNYSLDGQAFVPQALPTHQNRTGVRGSAPAPDNVHPLHLQRTEEFRQQAAIIRRQQEQSQQEEPFPSLAASAVTSTTGPSGQPLRTGWTAGTSLTQRVQQRIRPTGKVTDEDFPSLAASGGGGNGIGGTKTLQKKTQKTQTATMQFAAMAQSASSQLVSAASGLRSAETSSPLSYAANRLQDLTLDNFPSLRGNMTPGPSKQRPRPATSKAATAAPSKKSLAKQEPELTPDHFPSLGAGSGKKANQNRQAKLAPNNFPGLGGNTNLAGIGPVVQSPTQNNMKQPAARSNPPPSISSMTDFPAPPSVAANSSLSVRQRVLDSPQDGNRSAGASRASNVLYMATVAAPNVDPQSTIEDMKVSLGNAKFKQLKRYTKEFATGNMTSEAYVDHAAALFERGYADVDFWKFVPALLESCPSDGDAVAQALQYMQGLKGQTSLHGSSISTKKKAPPAGGWGVNGSTTTRIKAAPMEQALPQRLTVPGPGHSAPFLLQQKQAIAFPVLNGRPEGKTVLIQNSWGSEGGGGSVAVIAAARTPPGTVGAAAIRQPPQGGLETKFMAKERKQSKKQEQSAAAGTKINHKSQKDELRALAFGR
jgi:hypothetical protein